MTNHAQILWLDLEMTGLDAGGDLILEVATIATDWDFTELATYQGIVKNEDMTLDERLTANSVFWDANPASREGLLAQNSQGKDLLDVEDELLAFVEANFEPNTPVLMGGNSIHFDRRFIINQWPRLEKRLHYRMLDVSAWKVVFEGKYGKKFPKSTDHRALADIRESIKELEYYLSHMNLSFQQDV